MYPFNSKYFWLPFAVSAVLLSAFFAWELHYLPRPEPTMLEIVFTIVMILLLALDSGLVFFRLKKGTCPIGAKRATTVAGSLGIITLLCPACLLIPISLFGVTLSLTFLAPFLPLLRVVVLFLLIVSTMMLWPRSVNQK